MTERVIVGPCLTRKQAARRAGINTEQVQHRPDLLQLPGTWLEETYFAFQFGESGVRSDLGTVVQSLKGSYSDPEIADWLAQPNPLLDDYSPLNWLDRGRTPNQILAATRGFRTRGRGWRDH